MNARIVVDKLESHPWVAPLIFLSVACLSHLHQGTLAVDAIRYADIADHIVETGQWLDLYDAHTETPYVNKPPLLFWLLAILFQLFGYSTFIAKLPAALFVVGSGMLLWSIVNRLYAQLAAHAAVVLLVCNRIFARDLADLTFDGMSLCGALLCLREFMLLLQGERQSKESTFWIVSGLGALLILQSKMPYILLVAFPIFGTLLVQRRLKEVLTTKGFWCTAIGVAAITGAWLLYSGLQYVAGAFDNQFVEPVTSYDSRAENVLLWIRSILLSYAPASWLGCYGMWNLYRGNGPETRAIRQLLLLWILPAIAIVFIVAVRPRYMLLPSIPLFILAGKECALLVSRFFSVRHFRLGMLGASMLMLLVFVVLNVTVHRDDPIVDAFKRVPGLVENPPVVCVDGDLEYRSPRLARFTQQLLTLEFERPIKVVTSPDVRAAAQQLLANNECKKRLEARGVTLNITQAFRGAVLVN